MTKKSTHATMIMIALGGISRTALPSSKSDVFISSLYDYFNYVMRISAGWQVGLTRSKVVEMELHQFASNDVTSDSK